MLNLLCKKLSIPFYGKMLTWAAGRRESDGIWGKHWYGSVEASTGFSPYSKIKEDGLARVIVFDLGGQTLLSADNLENMKNSHI